MSASRPHRTLRALAARPKRLLPIGAALVALAAPPGAGAAPIDAEVTVNGVNVVDALVYKFRTEYPKPGGGTIVRQTPAVVNVPTLLDIDSDLLPDATATVHVTSIDHFVLKVERFFGENSDLGAQVELLVKDPTGALPRETVSLGFDARGARAPQSWTGTIDLLETSESSARIGLNFVKTGDTPKLAIIGGLHDGDDATGRKNPIAAHLKYEPVPATIGAELAIGTGHYEAQLTKTATATPTKLTGKVKYVDGAKAIDATTDIDGLPATLGVTYDETGPVTSDVVYTANSRVTKADVTYVEKASGAIEAAAEAHLSGVPHKVTVNRTSKSAGKVTAHGDVLDRAEVAYGAERMPAIPSNLDEPYLAFETAGTFAEMGDVFSLAMRVDRLKEVTFDAGTPMALDAVFAPLPGVPMNLTAQAKDSRWQLGGRVKGMPQQITLGVNSATGHIAYDGHGQPIEEITFDGVADAAHPFIAEGGYDHIDAKVTGLPPLVTVDIAPEGESVDVVATEPVGQVEADLHRGPDGCLAHLDPARSGGAFAATETASCAAGRISGVKEVHIRPEPLKVSYLGSTTQPVDIYATFDDPQDPNDQAALIEGTIDAVPTEFSMEMGPSNLDNTPVDKVTYRAKERIGRIDMTMRNMPGKFTEGDIHLEDIPRNLDLFVPLGTAKTRMVVDTYGEGVGRMALDLRNTPGGAFVLPEDKDTVNVNTRNGHTHIGVLVHDIRSVEMHTPLRADALATGSFKAGVVHTDTPKPLRVVIASDELLAEVKVPEPPIDMEIERPVGYTADGIPQPEKIVWRSSGITPEVTLGLRTDDLAMKGTLLDLPKDFDFCTWSGYGGLNSGPDDVDPSWCYQPKKAPLSQGGDPFTVFDNVQLTLDSLGPMSKPLRISELVMCPDPDPSEPEWSKCEGKQEANWTRIAGLKTGEVTAAVGTGVIFGCHHDPAEMAALYGTLMDSAACDEQDQNEGLHLFLDTDHHGLLVDALQLHDTPEAPADPADVSTITLSKKDTPITASGGLRVADLNGAPWLDYVGGILNCGPGFGINIQASTDLGDVDFDMPDGVLQTFLGC